MANLVINTYKDTETTEDLPLDPPKFSSPFASTVAIRQNFTPPKFSRVRYVNAVIINDTLNFRQWANIHTQTNMEGDKTVRISIGQT